MFFELLAFALLGVLIGIITGLTPGIHVNTVAFAIMPFAFTFNPYYIVVIIISVAATHTIFDFIPSILLGAPEADTALSTLPGHRLLLDGKGYEAICLTAAGSVGSMILSVFLLPLLLLAIPAVYSSISGHIHFILLFLSLLMIFTEHGIRMAHASGIFVLSGLLGMFTLNSFLIQHDSILFPIFSGLFGISNMLLSLHRKSSIPKQESAGINIKNSALIAGTAKGFSSGLLLGILPGLGAAQATVLSNFMTKKGNDREFLISMGAVNTAVSIFSLLSLYTIDKARSGASVAIQNIMDFGYGELLLTISIGFLSISLSAAILFVFLERMLGILTAVNYTRLTAAVITFITILTFVFTGFAGLLILATSTSIGLLAPLYRVKRSINMGVLMLPLIIFYASL